MLTRTRRRESMRVLLVHNFYQIPGGEDSVVQDELSVLKNNGVDVKLFSVTNDDIRGMSGKIQSERNPAAVVPGDDITESCLRWWTGRDRILAPVKRSI